MNTLRIAVIGGGNMGRAMIEGLLNRGHPPKDILLVETMQNIRQEIEKSLGITTTDAIDRSVSGYRIVIVAVKPQDVKKVLCGLAGYISDEQLIISVAAGISLAYMEKQLGKPVPIVRTMPNLAARIGKAAIALCPNSRVSQSRLEEACGVMESIGSVTRIEERQMDAVTGLSGSGPAFVFMLIEAMADAGVLVGLSRSKAMELVIQTLFGAASLLKERNIPPEVAKEMVTSPGGTAIEGVLKLEKGGFRASIMNAVRAAAEKSSQMEQRYSDYL
jgi:pyrroline-5-carboxylate reductase